MEKGKVLFKELNTWFEMTGYKSSTYIAYYYTFALQLLLIMLLGLTLSGVVGPDCIELFEQSRT